jgi:hypothetical protein
MERRMGRIADPLRFAVARQILQRGLSTNPDSGCLAQVGPRAMHQYVSTALCMLRLQQGLCRPTK